jgi:hypothetical protein
MIYQSPTGAATNNAFGPSPGHSCSKWVHHHLNSFIRSLIWNWNVYMSLKWQTISLTFVMVETSGYQSNID